MFHSNHGIAPWEGLVFARKFVKVVSLAVLETGFAGGAALFQLKGHWLGTAVLECVAFPTAFQMRNQEDSRLEPSCEKAVSGSLYWQKENILRPSHWWDQGLQMKSGSIKKTILHFFPLTGNIPVYQILVIGQYWCVEWNGPSRFHYLRDFSLIFL